MKNNPTISESEFAIRHVQDLIISKFSEPIQKVFHEYLKTYSLSIETLLEMYSWYIINPNNFNHFCINEIKSAEYEYGDNN